MSFASKHVLDLLLPRQTGYGLLKQMVDYT